MMLRPYSGRTNFKTKKPLESEDSDAAIEAEAEIDSIPATMIHFLPGRDDFKASQLSPSNSIHSGITCDQCSISPIVGSRYRCSLCPDYDLCSQCILNVQHKDSHLFLKINTTTQNLQRQPNVMNRELMVHKGIRCDGCQGNVIGFRYQCVQCQIDLCEECEATGVHDWTHPRMKLIPKIT